VSAGSGFRGEANGTLITFALAGGQGDRPDQVLAAIAQRGRSKLASLLRNR